MAMFGFPETMAEYGTKEYLRLFVIIAAYVIMRPHISRMFEKLQGTPPVVKEEEEPETVPVPKKDEGKSSSASWSWGSKAESRSKKERTKKVVVDEMNSDEDVSDLLD